jgi:iron(III) transport system ATP-binding protein
MMWLTCEALSFGYGGRPVLELANLTLQQGQIAAIIGPSGSGKSTLLRLIAGLEKPDRGRIVVDGCVLSDERSHVAVHQRPVGLVFQDYHLFPHMTLRQNIAYGAHQLPRRQRKAWVNQLLAMTELTEHANKYPHQASGGMQQRTAIARAMAHQPKVLLLDEPFSNLDASLTDRLRGQMKRWFADQAMTVILVTHDPQDAQALADLTLTLSPQTPFKLTEN